MRWMTGLVFGMLLAGTVLAKDEDVNAPRDFDGKWNYSDPAATEQVFRKLLKDTWGTEEAPDTQYIAELLTQIARTLGMQGKFEEAHKELDDAETLLKGTKGVGWARVYLERGRCFNSAKEREKATEIFKKALDVAKEAGADFYAVDAVHMLGISQPPEKALEWNLEAIKMAEASKHPRTRRWLGTLYNNTGWTYFEAKDYKTALDLFRRNAAFRKENKSDDRFARWSIGKALRMLGKLDEALVIQRELEKLREKDPDAFVFEELGELLWAKGDKAGAKPYFLSAYTMLRKVPWMQSETERMDAIRERAGLPKPEPKDDAEPKTPDEEDDK